MSRESDGSLPFFRIAFGCLMMVYAASKITDYPVYQDSLGVYPFDYSYRIHPLLFQISSSFPYYTTSHLYWPLHSSLLLLSAAGIAFAFGSISRLCCISFAVLQWMNLLRDISQHNNHEYLYVLIGAALFLTSCHDPRFSPLAQHAFRSSHRAAIALSLYVVSIMYMMLHNAVYGIAGHIAIIGMTGVWLATLLTVYDGMLSLDSTKTITLPSTIFDLCFMQILFGVVYLYAGIAKLDVDWLCGITMRELLTHWTGPTAPGTVLSILLETEGATWMAWAGAALDIGAGVFLLVPYFPLRLFFSIALVVFHLTNHFFFVIETFPWVMISSLVLYFDMMWVLGCAGTIEKCLQLKFVYSATCRLLNICHRALLPVLAVCFLLVHVLLPLPCALHGTDNMSWQSNCQHFSWRMMTRSTKGFSAMLQFAHPITNQFDIVALDAFGLTMIQQVEISGFEDMLFDVAQKAKQQAISKNGDATPPTVTADIWLQVNGPPIQRYIDPFVDITSTSPHVANYISSPLSLLQRPQPLLPIVKPRIVQYRTQSWFRRFAVLEKQYHRQDYQTLFFADTAPTKPLTIEFTAPALLKVLDGQLAIRNTYAINAGTCMRVRGVLAMSPTATNSTNSALWMISVRQNDMIVRPWNYEDRIRPTITNSAMCVHRVDRPKQSSARRDRKDDL